MKKEQIILIGGGGHCKSVLDVIEQEGRFEVTGIVDIKERSGSEILGHPVRYTDDDLPELVKAVPNFCITIGQVKSPAARMRIYRLLKQLNAHLPVIVSPRAYVSAHARIGEGSVIMGDVFINAGASVGVNCIVNSKALLEHDATVGDHCHISTGAMLNGDVIIGSQSFIGSCAMVSHGISIAERCIIGAGAVVTKKLEAAGTYIGNPARLFNTTNTK